MSSRPQIIRTTKNGSSQTSTKSEPEKIETPAKQAIGAVTDEDRALDRMLAARAADIPAGLDLTPGPTFRQVIDKPYLLSEHVENYQPANSLMSLEEQVFLARGHGADSIEATDMVFKAIFGYVPAEAYAIYKNVKMYKIGQVEAGRAKDKETIEHRLFSKSTLPTEPMSLENIGAKK